MLGRILLLQSALQAAPDEERLAGMVVRGLTEIPGVSGCLVCVEGKVAGRSTQNAQPASACPAKPTGNGAFGGCAADCPLKMGRQGLRRFVLRTSQSEYGAVFLDLEDREVFEPYAPFVDNTTHLISLHIENQRNAKALAEANQRLEAEVLERTAALRESEHNLSAVLNASPESAFLIDTRGRVITCNTVSAERLGCRPEDIVGRSIYDFIPGEAAAERRRHVEQVVRTGVPLHFQDVRSGRFFSHHLTPVLDRQGKTARIAVFGQDITEYREIEKDLKRQSEFLTEIRHAQDIFISMKDYRQAYEEILHALVNRTSSEYGFLDEVLYEADGTPYKLSLALSDISWDEASRDLYEQLSAQKLEFRNLNNLSGAPVLEGRTIIANDVPRHPDYRGLPTGHPPLITYMGIPLYFGNEIIGVVGVANREGGYTDEMAEFIKPLTQACSAMMRLTYVNQRMAHMLGTDPDEMIGKRLDTFIPAEDIADNTAKISRRQKGEPEVYERRFLHRDGSMVWTIVSATPIMDSEGRFAGSFGMVTDITDLKRAENELRLERDTMQRYLDTTDTIIVALDESGTITMMNRYGLELLGYDESRIIGKNWFDVALPEPEGREKVYPVFVEVMRGNIEQARYLENDVVTATGERRTIAWRNTYLCDAEGRRIGTLSAGLDITEQKRTEGQVRHIQKTESLGRMAGAIAHHFNNKLGVIMGNLELAQDDLPRDSPVSENLAQAMEGARRATDLSRMMLTYLGLMMGRREPMDMSASFARAVPMLKATMPGHVSLTADLPMPGPVVEANEGEMVQVLTNLVVNAWESFGNGDGIVYVRVAAVMGSDIPELHRFPMGFTPQQKNYACLEVTDAGRGIPEHDMEKLFDPFFSTKFTGRGLGLPVVLGIAQAHGGCIVVESRVQTGIAEPGTGNGRNAERGARSPEEGTDNAVKHMGGGGSVFRVLIPVISGS